MRRVALVLLMICSAGVAQGAPFDLDAFLRSVQEATKPATVVRADGTLAITAPDKTASSQVLLVERDTNDRFIELRQPALKGLILGGGSQAFLLQPGEKEAASWPAKDPFAESDFTREDLTPFVLSHYKTPRIADENEKQLTVALFPQQSEYIMVVYTFDREKKIPLKVMYYQETLSNLVKMRRDSDHVLIGQHWLPTKISMETFAMRSQSVFQLSWTQAPPVTPELFQPAFLGRPSSITWPAEPTTAPAP